MTTRNRKTYVLTEIGDRKVNDALEKQEVQERNRVSWLKKETEKSGAALSEDTIRKILKKEGVEESSIKSVFKALGLHDSKLGSEWELVEKLEIKKRRELRLFCIGRDKAIAKLDELFTIHKLVLVLGEGGRGKSTLANFYHQKFKLHRFHKLGNEIANAESLVNEWLQEFFGEAPSRQEFRIKLDRLRQYLIDDTRDICIVLDNLEPALKNGNFKEEHHRYIALLEVLSDPLVQSVTLITSREPINENGIRVYNYELPELDKKTWCEYFRFHEIQVGEKALENTNSALNQMHRAYGGNAECMYVLSGDILNTKEYGKDLVSYWETNKEYLLAHPKIEGLIKRQFDILQKDNPLAYRLLCRIGCYRYQDKVSTVSEDGILAMLWDDPRAKAKRVIKDLRDRCLIKFPEEYKGYFLHPIMREEAVSRLKDEHGGWTEEGIEANRKAAEFWSESVKTFENIDDALTAFEAYHHYVTINKYELAGEIIIKRESCKWEVDNEPLGVSFYRFGLLESVKMAINSVVEYMPKGEGLSRMYNILGDVYWLTGEIPKAIYSHEQSKKIAIEFDLKGLEAVAYLNTGLCKLDVWEIQQSIESFEKCIQLTQNTIFRYYTIESFYCLSFLNSLLGFKEKSIGFADKVFQELNLTSHSAWSTGYRWLFLGRTYINLSDPEKSFEMYLKALDFAKESNYTQVKAKALTGLAELYRSQQDFDKAYSHHKESIKLLDEIGAKCDLAEAYFQSGLTYQAGGKHDQAEEYKAKALELFEQMEAPKQIERVNKAFEQGAMK
jgi:tetratricopeptide (TPR) repeat protein